MTDIVVFRDPEERLMRKVEHAGIPLDLYILDLTSSELDPEGDEWAYAKAAPVFLARAEEELARLLLARQAGKKITKMDIRRAAGRVWGAAALAVRAYAVIRDGKRLRGYDELCEYEKRLEEELGDWIRDAWAVANNMRVCLYEGWCSEKDVGEALERIRRFVDTVTTILYYYYNIVLSSRRKRRRSQDLK